jgi:hypothetical protein
MSFPASGIETQWRNDWTKVSHLIKRIKKLNLFPSSRLQNLWNSDIQVNTISLTSVREHTTNKDSTIGLETSIGKITTRPLFIYCSSLWMICTSGWKVSFCFALYICCKNYTLKKHFILLTIMCTIEDPENIVAIHCNSGKGRAGTAATCLLHYICYYDNIL